MRAVASAIDVSLGASAERGVDALGAAVSSRSAGPASQLLEPRV